MTARRRVLLLAYHFPPIGGGGAQRSLKFARHLPELGYDVVVVTGPGRSTDRWSPRDETLLQELDGVEVRRVRREEPPVDGRFGRRERWLGLPSPWSRWWVDGALEEGLRAGEPDVVLASMSPYATAVAAARLARAFGRPWVADLRDPWALDEMTIYPSRAHRDRERRRMRERLRGAAAVVANTPEAERRIRALLADAVVTSIPNGFDREDFERASGDGAPAARRGTFRIVHTGSLHTDLGLQQRRSRAHRVLGGAARGVDLLTRSHVYLLEALERLVRRDPSLRARLELVLAGVLSSGDRAVAARSPLTRLPGYLSHDATIGVMRTADLLFLPMQNLPAGVRATSVPGKTYEYLAAERPILAAVPEGDARDLLLRAGTAHVCAPDDVAGMAAAVQARLGGTTALRARVPDDVLARFERRSLARELAALLDSLTTTTTTGSRSAVRAAGSR